MFKIFEVVKDIDKLKHQLLSEAQKTQRIVEVNGKPLDKIRKPTTAH